MFFIEVVEFDPDLKGWLTCVRRKGRGGAGGRPFNHPFIQQICLEPLLCAWHCSLNPAKSGK